MRDKEKVERLVAEGKHFCMVPWVHLHTTALGNMSPCMSLVEGSEASGYGNLNENSFHELWQGERIRKLRLRMLEDKASFNCKKCYERESVGYWSQRTDANKKYGHYLDWVVSTDEKGYAPDAKPIYWDIRFSNLCNLKCRMCSYSASSAWYEDAIELGQIDPKEVTKKVSGVENTAPLLDELEQYIPHLEKVHFAGGEPLLLNENTHILERLKHYEKFDTDIKYNTNLTTLKHKGKNITELWEPFNNIKLNVSIDGVEKRCEYVRKNLKWNTFVQNIAEVKSKTNVKVIINITVSIFNILQLREIHHYMLEHNYIEIDHICLNLLHSPEEYSIKILPTEVKEVVTSQLQEHVSWLKEQEPYKSNPSVENTESLEQWEAIISYMNSGDWSSLIPKFIESTAKLDLLRDEKLLDVFPELNVLYMHKEAGVSV